MRGWPGVGAGCACAQGGVRAGGHWRASPTPATPSQLQFWHAWGFLSAPRVVICQEHSLKAQRHGASPGDTASALPDSATPQLHCWVVLMEPLLARNRGCSAHLQRGCVPPPRPVARGCCEERLGGGLTGRSLSPPRALAPPAEAAAPPLTGCPPRPGGHTPPARGASWAGRAAPHLPCLLSRVLPTGAAAGGQGGRPRGRPHAGLGGEGAISPSVAPGARLGRP